jgi:hypothetical protein
LSRDYVKTEIPGVKPNSMFPKQLVNAIMTGSKVEFLNKVAACKIMGTT